MAIYVKHGDQLIEMTEQRYDAESVLQQLLSDYPNLLVGDQDSDPRRRWLLVQPEMGIGTDPDQSARWSLDHLFLDEEGIPTLVEVKRSTDTRIRREVVGQMLDYAANAAGYWGIERIRAAFEAAHDDPDAVLEAHLGADPDVDAFWSDVATNLRAGRLRLVFVADVIPPELRRIVEFLNEQMDRTHVLAIEVKQYLAPDSDLVTLVPRLIGQTEAAKEAKTGRGRPKRRWVEQDLIDRIRQDSPGTVGEHLVNLYEWIKDRPDTRLSWGHGQTDPSVTVWLGERDDDTANPVAVSLSPRTIGPWFSLFRDRRSPEELQRLTNLLRAIPNVAPYLQGIEDKGFAIAPSIPIDEVLATAEQLDAWKRALAEGTAPPRPDAEGAQGSPSV